MSKSPDLVLAGHEQPPPLVLSSVPRLLSPSSSQGLPPKEVRIDVGAAPVTPETFVVEVPHEHHTIDGLTIPKTSDQPCKGEEMARVSGRRRGSSGKF